MLSTYIEWLIFSCNLLSLYPVVHFLIMWLSGIIGITNNNGDSASPWNLPLWIFTSAKLFPPVVVSTHQVRMIFSINCTTWLGIIIIIIQSFSHQCKLMVFHWRLNNSKSPQVSRTLLSILAVFNNAVSTRPPNPNPPVPLIIL